MSSERKEIIGLVNEACGSGARQSKACECIGISAKTFQRWCRPGNAQDGRLDAKHEPCNKLTELERQRIIKVANEPEYANLPPSKIVPKLADKGIFLASESTYYRILKSADQLCHRQKARPTNPRKKPMALTATGPNQIYSWDITYLPTAVKGIFLYLYLVMDIYSRKIVGWQVYEEESSALAGELMTDICQREDVAPDQVTLHSDNGSPMKGATLLATLQDLGVIPSFSRPSVSNDNPYSESLFRTLKYRPEYPGRSFISLLAARNWVQGFVRWYNHEHLHSGINFVTPEQRHKGLDAGILAQRKKVYEQAKARHPERWSGEIRNWEPVGEIHLNPEKKQSETKVKRAA
jgi:transposase InsO family protein